MFAISLFGYSLLFGCLVICCYVWVFLGAAVISDSLWFWLLWLSFGGLRLEFA